MVKFASELRLLWSSQDSGDSMTDDGIGAIFCATTFSLACSLEDQDEPEAIYTEQDIDDAPDVFRPSIILNADFYLEALQCANRPGTPEIIRKHLWFMLAKTV